MRRFLEGLGGIKGARLYGLAGDNELGQRVPTFSLTLPGVTAKQAVTALAEQNIFAWAGSFYAHEAAERLGVNPHGVIRVGLAHYTSPEEVDRVIGALGEMASR
jgi:selenocysteine lyase/cysteine desulfurase